MDANQLAQLLGTWSSGEGPLYRQLARGIGDLIDQGALRHRVRLPAERTLATALSVSRSTTVAAYSELAEAGRLVRRQGSGTEVVASGSPGPEREQLRSSPLFDPRSESRALLQAVPPCLVDLGEELRALADEGPLVVEDMDPGGWWDLRVSIAARYTAEGLPTDPTQVLVTNGTQQGCALLLRELCQPGDTILCEEHTWPGLTDAAERIGARCHGLPMDHGGMDITRLPGAIERLRPAAIVVNPHHHNPTGTRLLPYRRRELADIAADYGVLVIEDRVFASLAFDGVVPPPLQAERDDAPIAVVDSLSKTVWCGYRVGWVRASADLIGRLKLVKAIDDLGTSVPSQLLAYRIFDRLDSLIAERCTDMAARGSAAHELATSLLPDWSIPMPPGGAALWAELPEPVARSFVRHAARCGVPLIGGDAFAVAEGTGRHVRLPFTAPREELFEALHRVADAWGTFDSTTARRHGLPSPTLV